MRATLCTGTIYLSGKHVKIDMKKSFHFYRLAAEQGRAKSQVYLAKHYESGDGAARDFDVAFSWFKKAAAQGEPEAECALGLCYEKGRGCAVDMSKAMYWWRKAAVGLYLRSNAHLDSLKQGAWGVNPLTLRLCGYKFLLSN